MKRKLFSLAVVIILTLQTAAVAFAAEDSVLVDGFFYSPDMKKIVSWSENIDLDTFTIPDGVTEIAEGAFANGCPVKTLYVADSVEKIDENAFFKSGVEVVRMSKDSKLTEIEENAFANSNLKSIFLPNNSVEIDDGAFVGCISLEAINLWQEGESDSLMLRPGDIDGDSQIIAAEARTVLRIAARLESSKGYAHLLGDIDRDGKLTSADARQILRKAANLA